MSSVLEMPLCPECGSEMGIEIGSTVVTGSGVMHSFECLECGGNEEWSGEELLEMGVRRPSFAEFVEYFDVGVYELLDFFGPVLFVEFVRDEAGDISVVRERDVLVEKFREEGVGLGSVESYFSEGVLEEFVEYLVTER